MDFSVNRSRRGMMKAGLVALGASGLAACGATPTAQVIKEVVTQVVEREVTVIVEGTSQVVKETVIVEGTPQIVKETVVVPAAGELAELRWVCYDAKEPRNTQFRSMATSFSEQNPNINVTFEIRPGEGFWDKLQTEFAGGTSPDVTINQFN